MTAQRMGFCMDREQGLDGRPGLSTTSGSTTHMMKGDLHLVVGGWETHPDFLGATTHDRWMVTSLIRKCLTGPRPCA